VPATLPANVPAVPLTTPAAPPPVVLPVAADAAVKSTPAQCSPRTIAALGATNTASRRGAPTKHDYEVAAELRSRIADIGEQDCALPPCAGFDVQPFDHRRISPSQLNLEVFSLTIRIVSTP